MYVCVSYMHAYRCAYLAHEEEVALGDGAVGLQEVRLEVHVEQVARHALCVCLYRSVGGKMGHMWCG